MFNFFYYKQHIKAFKVREKKTVNGFHFLLSLLSRVNFWKYWQPRKKLSDLIIFKNNLGFKMLALYQKSIVENNQVVFSLAF